MQKRYQKNLTIHSPDASRKWARKKHHLRYGVPKWLAQHICPQCWVGDVLGCVGITQYLAVSVSVFMCPYAQKVRFEEFEGIVAVGIAKLFVRGHSEVVLNKVCVCLCVFVDKKKEKQTLAIANNPEPYTLVWYCFMAADATFHSATFAFDKPKCPFWCTCATHPAPSWLNHG